MLNKERGFSLLEVLVATSIFMVFAASVISLITLNTKNSSTNKHRLEAANLAREGTELVTQIQKTNVLNGNDPFLNIGVGTGGSLLLERQLDGSWILTNSGEEIVPGADGTTYTRRIYIE